MTIEVEEVEEDVGDRVGFHSPPHDVRVGLVNPLLQTLEAGAALLVEGDQLAVEDRIAGAELARRVAAPPGTAR